MGYTWKGSRAKVRSLPCSIQKLYKIREQRGGAALLPYFIHIIEQSDWTKRAMGIRSHWPAFLGLLQMRVESGRQERQRLVPGLEQPERDISRLHSFLHNRDNL